MQKKILHIKLIDESATQEAAFLLASCIHSPLVISFSGEIGAGKTTFIRALLAELGVKSIIKSPTFSLVESYNCRSWPIHHFDLYRIHDEDELEFIGFRDYFDDNAIICVEWPERAKHSIKSLDLWITLMITGSSREMIIESLSAAGDKVLFCFEGKE
ncbi:ATPase or kinase [Legionella quinlivanii]|uniref:tRNA threonylcarbamoyladenosine biosynthesis protein TsaE n=1 Tax=Legionella quinlivanii TaxID=45073 RepID=A0A0W0Y096_9GAMM|nr:tRNA (adenosine(37)-N6)-threonylcarbamoyltransferase complex ATPase subunit type 1 TsaE [Legionella quinlivanii]KTD50396.1 ATPase or kinase [Legionella quinlivanii]SEF41375.1 tRNA threonylcarbamoyladenosine biosynthesis protein TsaE [Legionella quinlivanii DSM 21216]STY11996.1 ATPase or kinase [Legionella quinlivanii]